jgi:hypothetical protein
MTTVAVVVLFVAKQGKKKMMVRMPSSFSQTMRR